MKTYYNDAGEEVTGGAHAAHASSQTASHMGLAQRHPGCPFKVPDPDAQKWSRRRSTATPPRQTWRSDRRPVAPQPLRHPPLSTPRRHPHPVQRRQSPLPASATSCHSLAPSRALCHALAWSLRADHMPPRAHASGCMLTCQVPTPATGWCGASLHPFHALKRGPSGGSETGMLPVLCVCVNLAEDRLM